MEFYKGKYRVPDGAVNTFVMCVTGEAAENGVPLVEGIIFDNGPYPVLSDFTGTIDESGMNFTKKYRNSIPEQKSPIQYNLVKLANDRRYLGFYHMGKTCKQAYRKGTVYLEKANIDEIIGNISLSNIRVDEFKPGEIPVVLDLIKRNKL